MAADACGKAYVTSRAGSYSLLDSQPHLARQEYAFASPLKRRASLGLTQQAGLLALLMRACNCTSIDLLLGQPAYCDDSKQSM